MASTFSPSLRIELIGDGDQSGIWGQTTNNNLGTLIEQAIAGVVTITMVDANYTLSNFNGVTDEARNQVIVATGTNAAVRDIIIPLAEKTYTIKNSTTGGFGVRSIGSSGTGVTVPNGVTTTVYCDGINVFTAMSGTTNDFTVSGNLTVTGSSTIAPIGSILMWSTGSAPTGYLLCNGAAVSRSTYAGLFAVVGTTFGAGDTTTTFNLPNYTNRMPYGTTVGATGGSTTITAANLPSHTHTVVGNTGAMSGNQNHVHGVNDPGHQHSYRLDVNGASVAFVGNQGNLGGATLGEGAGPAGSISSGTQSSSTSVSIQSANVDHTHGINLTSGPTGSGDAFITPYLGISFIIKF
jgi:microcystin-dependent protein